jgi:hypothetical protein
VDCLSFGVSEAARRWTTTRSCSIIFTFAPVP